MRLKIQGLLLGITLTLFSLAATARDFHSSGTGGGFQRGSQTLVIDIANAPPAQFLFLQADTGQDVMTRSYLRKVKALNRTMAAQPGFRAYMTLHDLERDRMAVYYQFDTAAQREQAWVNGDVMLRANELQNSSVRFDNYPANVALNPLPAPPPGDGGGQPNLLIEINEGDGFGINEAIVVEGRTQAELSFLMQTAGNYIFPNDSPGFLGNVLHEAEDQSRNFNMLHWTSTRTMTVGGLVYLVQGLINAGRTGIIEGWGPNGVGLIGVDIYDVIDIYNAAD